MAYAHFDYRLGAPGLPGIGLDTQSQQDCKDTEDIVTMATTATLTPTGTLSFLNIKTPRPVVEGGQPRYSVNIIFDEAAQRTPEFMKLQEAIANCISDKWGKKVPSNLRMPLRDGAEKEGTYAGYRKGTVFINPWSKEAFGVVDRQKQDIIDVGSLYAGQLGRAKVRPFAYDTGSNKGVGLLIDNLQIVKDGPRIDGKASAASSFPDDEDRI
jgi:hypothetical protein